MKIILSRKGFDQSFGGTPSPILSDGRMVSLPIPSRSSLLRYSDIRWQEYNLGTLVAGLTKGRISGSHPAHLDPDLRAESLRRSHAWRPIFGQAGAAQGHLGNNGVQSGDLFLFFGLFRETVWTAGGMAWRAGAPLRHVIWGWLQIDEVLKVAGCDLSQYRWAEYHPHFHGVTAPNNTLYTARRSLSLPGTTAHDLPGAGAFTHFSGRLALTAPEATMPTQWVLPGWCHPAVRVRPMTYHRDLGRWQRTESGARLRAAARGQEFILDIAESPEATGWLQTLIAGVEE